MPHKPEVEDFPCMRHMAQIIIDESEPLRKDRYYEGDGEFFRVLGEQRVILALIAYLHEEPLAKSVSLIRAGLGDIRTAFELRVVTNAWQLWDYFLYAVAVGDVSLAQFLAALRDRDWWNTDIKPAPWLVKQVKALFALFRNEDAGRLLRDLKVMVFDEQLPEELEEMLPEIRGTYHLLDALHRRDAAAFNAHLAARMDVRAAYFAGCIAPIALLDLHGVGLARLALQRKMLVTLRHTYFPAELLQIGPA